MNNQAMPEQTLGYKGGEPSFIPVPLRILILEDNPRDLDLVRRELDRTGLCFLARHATGRESFLELLRCFQPHLVLSDYAMPQFDGMEALLLLRECAPDVPDIIVTGSMNEEVAVECMKAGAADYVLKQHLVRLGPAIQGALARQQLMREKEAAESRTLRAAQEWRATFDAMSDAVCLLGLDRRIERCNRAFRDLVGKPWAEILGRRCHEVVHGSDVPAAGCPFDAALATGEVQTLEVRGGDRVLTVKVSMLHGDDGVPLGAVQVLEDITDHRRAEEARERLTAAIEQAGEEVVITDTEGAIQYVNPAFEAVTGYVRAEVLGKNPRILQSGVHDRAFYAGMWHALTTEGRWQGRIVNRRKSGEEYTEEATLSVVRDAAGNATNYVAVKRDITEDLRKEEKLRQSQKMEAVGQLAAGVAHDFNNVLQAVTGYNALLLEHLDRNTDLYEFACEVEEASRRAASLTRQLLTFSRRSVFAPEDLDTDEVARGMVKMLGRVLGEDVRLELREGSRGLSIHADRGGVEQILMNLAINARDAMAQGGLLVIETRAVESPLAVALVVTDTGHGMDAATLKRIYEPFFTTKEQGKGTGLGLATVWEIVQQHAGSIVVTSTPGKGTTFTVTLPATTVAAAAADAAPEASPRTGNETILLAEDDPTLQGLARLFLEQAGYRVLAVGDGRAALEAFDQHRGEIALALLDVVMPTLGGRGVYEMLRMQEPGLRFLFSSGYGTGAVQTEFLQREGIAYLQKPYSPTTLVRKVREVLDAPVGWTVSGPGGSA